VLHTSALALAQPAATAPAPLLYLGQQNLPRGLRLEGTTIGGIVLGEKLLIAHHDVVVEPGDHVILFVMDKRGLAKVSALFQTGATWL
jgi:Trk K+ transport system NAD-binding subunit